MSPAISPTAGSDQWPSIVASSLPGNYCEAENWVRQFGIGSGLIGVGVAGLIILFTVIWENEYFDRPLTRGWSRS